MKKHYKVIIYGFFASILLFNVFTDCFGENSSINKKNLDFKNILIAQNEKVYPDYEEGKQYFSDYAFWGLPDTFLIKKAPDISIKPKEIYSIEIKRMPYVLPTASEFRITIKFTESGAEKMYTYTKNHINEKLAFCIGEKIFYIAQTLTPIEHVIRFDTIKIPFAELRELLSQLTDNIETINIRREERTS